MYDIDVSIEKLEYVALLNVLSSELALSAMYIHTGFPKFRVNKDLIASYHTYYMIYIII
jgi:hypothetical protein